MESGDERPIYNMTTTRASILVLALLASAAGSNQLKGKVHIPSGAENDFLTTTKVLLDGGQYVGYLSEEGYFTINDLPSASYHLEVASPKYTFQPLRVDVDSRFDNGARAFKADPVGGLPPVSVPYSESVGLNLRPMGRMDYFEPKKQWSILDALMNPMILMAVLPMALMYMMPSKEAMEEMKKELAEENGGQDPIAMPSFSLADTLAGMTAEPKPATTSSKKKKKQ
eukprot:TRINITY_DN7098_c0_g1_i1.p1 TRINITY_DN7098_c0_g1~~TRINITY_DN7098_c0_g1_i1.p1  ORF type:complete len:227 (+),score=57.71 TRINITY_DN7098_c0_g1_i1:54-734(+)